MGESRVELLSWLNQLTGLGIQKVEQCGKGYPCAQIFDSIYGDVPLKKIDFNANTEVKYLANWKIVQTHLARHKIDKVVPIDRLVKCKMQDNLEFLQWCKKYWDQYFPGGDYDAAGRRGGIVTSTSASLNNSVSSHAPSRPTAATTSTRKAPIRSTAPTQRPTTSAQTSALQAEISGLTETVLGLEKERDFYFNKLRDIEILIQTAAESDPEIVVEGSLLKQIQDVLYSTEEGFEVPQQEENGLAAGVEGVHVQDDDEVF